MISYRTSEHSLGLLGGAVLIRSTMRFGIARRFRSVRVVGMPISSLARIALRYKSLGPLAYEDRFGGCLRVGSIAHPFDQSGGIVVQAVDGYVQPSRYHSVTRNQPYCANSRISEDLRARRTHS